MTLPFSVKTDRLQIRRYLSRRFKVSGKKDLPNWAGLRLSKKSSESWAFSILYGIIVPGDVRCWNEEKWNEESLRL